MVVPAAPATAQRVEFHFERLSLDVGLSDYAIETVTRERGGYLWVGTQSGLNRYDGARVRAFLPVPGLRGTLPDGYVHAVERDPAGHGGLWVITVGGLSRFDSGTERFITYGAQLRPSSASSPEEPTALHATPDGALWVGTAEGGLYRLTRRAGGGVAYRPVPGAHEAFLGGAVRVLASPRATPGVLWVGTANGLVLVDVSRGGVTRAAGDSGAARSDAVTAIAEAGGAVWAVEGGALYRFDPSAQRRSSVPLLAGSQPTITALAASRAYPYRLWVGTRGRGLLAFDTRTLIAVPVVDAAGAGDDFGRALVTSLEEDEEGVLWVGTIEGLYRAPVSRYRFPAYTRSPDLDNTLSASEVTALYEAPSQPGVVWAGTVGGGLNRFDRRTGTYRHYLTEVGHPFRVVSALHEASDGTFWVGGDRPALYLMDRATGLTRAYPLSAGANIVYQIYRAPSQPGTLWIATDGGGLAEFDLRARRVVRRFSTEGRGRTQLGSDDVWSVLEVPGEPGVLWVATHGGGLERLDVRAGTVERVRARSGCRLSDRVVSLAAGADGVLWLGTFDEGLMRYDRRRGACRAYTQEQGLAHTDVGGIFLDEAGRLWLTTSNGLSRFDPVREAFTRFTEEDGLPSNTFRYPARHRNAAGELLLGGTRGFTIFRPDAVPADTTPPRVAITRLLVDGQPYPLVREGDGFRPIRLRYGQNDLAFEYAALDLRAPGRTRYRVRLEGADTTWRYVGAQAADRYPRLAPGHYAFGVEGTNADGYWSTAPTALAFIIRPPLWQTWYFWGLVAVLVGAVVAAGYQYRIRQIRRVAETRQRIADDLHDDIGSKISTVALRLALAARNPALPEEERADLDGLARASRDVVGGVRDAVWFADGSNDDLAALVARMEQTAQEMLSGRPYSFDRPDVLAPSLLTMAVRHELFLLFKEAVHNAVKYGEPPVGVRVGLDERRFQFSITDAGPGFDPGAVKRGRGLSTMARRAAALGGELRVDSTPGGRTSVSFVLPSRKHPGRWAAVRSLLRRPPGR